MSAASGAVLRTFTTDENVPKAEDGTGMIDPEAALSWGAGAAAGTVLLGRTEYTVRVADLQTDTERWNVSFSEASRIGSSLGSDALRPRKQVTVLSRASDLTARFSGELSVNSNRFFGIETKEP